MADPQPGKDGKEGRESGDPWRARALFEDLKVEIDPDRIDEAVKGVVRPEVQTLKDRGLKLYACAYGAHRHGVPVDAAAAFAGLTVVSDLIAGTDRFVSFN